MNRRTLTKGLTALSIAMALGAGVALPASAGTDKTSGVVYVESNAASDNAILAYRRSPQGDLTPLPGSPFATGGKGVFDLSLDLGPFDSDQLITTNADKTLLFAVNAGSNTIAVFRIHADGSLAAVAGSPFPSGGINPVSVGVARDTLVVVNKAMDPRQSATSLPNYTSFHFAPDGRIDPVPLSTVTVGPTNSPSQALISANQRLVFGADFFGGLLQSFQIGQTGSLAQNAPQALPATAFEGSPAPRLPLGLTAHPNRPVVYVGLVTVNKIAVYSHDNFGVLSFVRTVDDSGSAPCWLRTNADGSRLYVSNTGDSSITVYDTTDPLAPKEIQKLTLKGEGSPFQIEFDPRGNYLYVVNQRAIASTPIGQGNTLHTLRVNANGHLTEPGSPTVLDLPLGTRPQGLATF
ncbi:MAG: beta-propeller fold lactonase family protein [Burkholderiaceae bacterium]